MKRCILSLGKLLMAAVALCSGVAAAEEVYKWVSPDGVTHFSETAPEAAFASMEVIEFEATEPAKGSPPDYRKMLEVADSIEASRLERERLRLEKRQLARQQRPQASASDEDDEPLGTRIYYGYGYHPGYRRPDYRHLHDKPHLRPLPAPFPGRNHNKPRTFERRPDASIHIAR